MKTETWCCAVCKTPYTVTMPESLEDAGLMRPLPKCPKCGFTAGIGVRRDYADWLERTQRQHSEDVELQKALTDKLETYELPEALPEFQNTLKRRRTLDTNRDKSHQARKQKHPVRVFVKALRAEYPDRLLEDEWVTEQVVDKFKISLSKAAKFVASS